jgi:hypothetical protein
MWDGAWATSLVRMLRRRHDELFISVKTPGLRKVNPKGAL